MSNTRFTFHESQGKAEVSTRVYENTHAACVLEKVYTSREEETRKKLSGAAQSLIWQTHVT